MNTIEQFSHFDENHWHKVKAARAQQGIIQKTEDGMELVVHWLRHETLTDPATGKTYFVECLKRKWQRGWFTQATLVRDGLKIFCVAENQSSICPDVLRSHTAFQQMFGDHVMEIPY